MTWTPAVKQLNVLRQGGEAFPNLSEWNDAVVLDGTNAASYDLAAARTAMGLAATAPLFCMFSSDGAFWFNPHGTCSIPSVSTADGTASIINPTARYLDNSVTTLGFKASAATKVSLQFYKT